MSRCLGVYTLFFFLLFFCQCPAFLFGFKLYFIRVLSSVDSLLCGFPSGLSHRSNSYFLQELLLHVACANERKTVIKDHANPEGNGPQCYDKRGRKGPRQPPRRQYQHHQNSSSTEDGLQAPSHTHHPPPTTPSPYSTSMPFSAPARVFGTAGGTQQKYDSSADHNGPEHHSVPVFFEILGVLAQEPCSSCAMWPMVTAMRRAGALALTTASL